MLIVKKINIFLFLSCITGLALSCYALFVEMEIEKDSEYSAYCDINEYISCTKAFSSQYGKGFGILGRIFGKDSILNQPNSIGGIIFYSLMALSSFINNKEVLYHQLLWCIISNFLSMYLACILYFILSDFCIVCVSTYIVNALTLMLILFKKSILQNEFCEIEVKNK